VVIALKLADDKPLADYALFDHAVQPLLLIADQCCPTSFLIAHIEIQNGVESDSEFDLEFVTQSLLVLFAFKIQIFATSYNDLVIPKFRSLGASRANTRVKI
jgi:hypothetical protein